MPRDENAIVRKKNRSSDADCCIENADFFPQTFSIHDNMCHTFYLSYLFFFMQKDQVLSFQSVGIFML